MISLSEVTLSFGTRTLFEDVTWRLHPGTHYGLVGANGTGKSTLLRLMAGELTPDVGKVSRPNDLRMGVLPQDHFRYDALPLLDVVMMGKPKLWQALQEKKALLARFPDGKESDLSEAEGHRLGELEGLISDENGYVAESFAATLLEGLGLPVSRHANPMSEQSGGYRLRVLLAQTLFGEPQILLLDEPTNHLDILSIQWLETYLGAFAGTLVVVSHDRHFLNGVSDHIADVDYGELRHYPGNYDRFVAAKELAEEQKGKEIVRTERKIAEMQQFIVRFKAKATKARQAQSRQKMVDRMVMPEVKRSSRRFPSFRFQPTRPSGREVLTVKGLCKSYEGRAVLSNVGFQVNRGDKLAVVGPNGIGKTTLLTIIAGENTADAGEVLPGFEVHLGFFAQEDSGLRRGKSTVYDWLYSVSPNKEIGLVRGVLGKVLFSGDEADKALGTLSGGESTRLRLAGLMVRGDNLLLLDEPTNHLDLEGRESLQKAVMGYQGTLMFVSHDRRFVSSVATRVLAITPEGVEDFHGTYEEYLAKQGDDFLSVEKAAGLSTNQPRGGRKNSGPPQDFAARKAQKKEQGRLHTQVEKLERKIGMLEGQLETMAQAAAQKAGNGTTHWQELQEQEATRKATQKDLESTIAAWESAAGELEQLKSEG